MRFNDKPELKRRKINEFIIHKVFGVNNRNNMIMQYSVDNSVCVQRSHDCVCAIVHTSIRLAKKKAKVAAAAELITQLTFIKSEN